MQRSSLSFDELIAPVARETFLARYWEKRFLHLPRNEERHFDGLFSLADIDRWIGAVRSGPANSILVTPPEGADGGVQRYRPQDVGIDALYEAVAKGSSLVLNQLEVSWPPFFPLVRDLGCAFAADIGVNVYLTPRGSRTFPLHVDDHDVLVLQLHGEKVWQLHEIKLAAVNAAHLTHEKDIATTAEWGVGRVQTRRKAEVRLAPGDLLYVPRGMPHCAKALDVASLHLTISITPFYWMDLLKAAVEQAQVHTAELRRALPPGFLTDPRIRAKMRRDFARILPAFLEHLDFDEALEVVMRHRVRAQGFPSDGHFSSIEALASLAPQSFVARRPGISCMVENNERFSNIRFGARQVQGPARLGPAFEFIRDRARFRASDLPGLDEASCLVLVRRLVREGLLQIEPAGEPQALAGSRRKTQGRRSGAARRSKA